MAEANPNNMDTLNRLLQERGLIGICKYYTRNTKEFSDIVKHEDELPVVPSNRVTGVGNCSITYENKLIADLSFILYDNNTTAYISMVSKEKSEYDKYSRFKNINVKVGKAAIFKFAFLMLQLGVKNIEIIVAETEKGQLFKYYASLGFKCMKPSTNNISGSWESRNDNDPWKRPTETSIGSIYYNDVNSWYYNCFNMEASPQEILNNCCNI